MQTQLARVIDLLNPDANQLYNVDLQEARRRVLTGDPDAVRGIDGSFALVAVEGRTVRMARSMDRPMRYFLAKRAEGPALYVADRIDTLRDALEGDGIAFRGFDEKGHSVVTDSGEGAVAPSPVVLLLLALGGCSGMDVIGILRKKRQQVSAYEILLDGTRRDEFPRSFTAIEVVQVKSGQGI